MVLKKSTGNSMVVESKPVAIDKVRKAIISELEANNFGQDEIFAVHLALEESFINAIKHGNKMEPNKRVKIDYLVCSDKAEIYLEDEGSGFDPNVVPDPRYGENLYRTEGRGLFLIRSYMDVAEFNKRGNCLHMVKYKQKQHLKKEGKGQGQE
jgi:serine/threonine-protein kinase RsbW